MTIKNQIRFFLSKKGIFLFVCEAGEKPVGAKKRCLERMFRRLRKESRESEEEEEKGISKKLR